MNAKNINNHFLIEIFSFKKIKLNINPKGTVNWVPIIIGDTKDEISKAKYKVTYTPIPIVIEKVKSGKINFFEGNLILKKGNIPINIIKTLNEENKIGGMLLVPNFPSG